MASMQWTFSDVYTKVAEFLGLGSSPTGTDLTKVKDLVYRGYMLFLLPIHPRKGNHYTWSWLEQEATLRTESGKWEYLLPSDFFKFCRKMEYDSTETKYPINEVTVRAVMNNRAVSASSTAPTGYAVRTSKFDTRVGSTKELVIWPTPNAVYNLNYSYVITPEKPVNDTDLFIGGPLESEAILECCLAAAESQEDETAGIHTKNAYETISKMILADEGDSPTTVGFVQDTNIGRVSPYDLKRMWLHTGVATVYGETLFN